MVLGIKEGLVECATVCVKSVVILNKTGHAQTGQVPHSNELVLFLFLDVKAEVKIFANLLKYPTFKDCFLKVHIGILKGTLDVNLCKSRKTINFGLKLYFVVCTSKNFEKTEKMFDSLIIFSSN